ncbi:DUF2304 domain-containing protein [Paenibacillus cremeus]|uniref:DUF2304 domain-containing protein n=1 Tax=Paenibacillus cremeus TaxID=2163881 RepID=A0A559K6E4_9BACL|nr:DUF2304 domain-containing protein [Paenibacillus cremeus]TVY07712.1 DUF2304 domain-containing protein [Paenibacillus cremeus]
MNSTLKLFILCCGIGFSCGVMYLLLKKKINERHSIIWLGGVTSILVITAFPEWFDKLAVSVGVSYPPALLFLLSILVLALVVLYQSMQISILNEKLKELVQYMALEQPGLKSDEKCDARAD